jgi:N6-L-threonylcarbamoyladenine synthase
MIGQTRDDSLGEAYDKLGRMLNYKFPAGPKIDNKAKLGQPNIKFPSPLYKKGFDFSFSGLKSSVSRYLENNESYSDIDICASFVESVLKVLDDKIRRSIEVHSDTKSLVIVGGVAASKQVRDLGLKISNDFNIELKLPSIKWATDNGAMIAMAGWDYLNKEAFIKAEPLARIPINEY